MKRLLLIASFSFAFFSVSGQQSVSIEQCYGWAEENYPQIKRYGLINQAMQYDLSNAAKAWLPQVALSAKATYQSDVTKFPLDFSALPAPMNTLSVPTLSKDQYQVAAEVSQTIWDGGLTHSSRMITRAQAEADRKQTESDLYALKDRINQLYFGCLLQDDLLAQNRLLQQELNNNLDRISAMIQNGTANESDKELLEVELLNVRQRETELNASRSAFLRMLAYFTGQSLPPDTELRKPALPNGTLSMTINRPELSALDAGLQVAEMRNKQITSGLMPRFGAFVQAGYGRPGLNMLEDSFNPFYIAGVRMSWNLGKLYTLKNDRRKVGIARQQIDMAKETFLFNTQLQLIQQDENVRKIDELMRSDEEIVRLRSNVKKASEAKLENGVIAVSDLVRDIISEDMAKQSASIRRTQYIMAVYQFMHITNEK